MCFCQQKVFSDRLVVYSLLLPCHHANIARREFHYDGVFIIGTRIRNIYDMNILSFTFVKERNLTITNYYQKKDLFIPKEEAEL